MKSPEINHVIWDWNGTLFDDQHVTVASTVQALSRLGRPGLTSDEIKAAHRRPLRAKFSDLLGREISPEELQAVLSDYEQEYESVMFSLDLVPGARSAISSVSRWATQSILSMAPHNQLVKLVEATKIGSYFSLVSGTIETSISHKSQLIVEHCEMLKLQPQQTVIIGDTVDDYDAAMSVGANAILVPTGIQSLSVLRSSLATVALTLDEAATLAAGLGDLRKCTHPRIRPQSSVGDDKSP